MSDKLYTAAEVAALIAAERAKTHRAVTISRKSGVNKAGKPFSGIEVKGDFFPVYLSENAAKGILDNIEALREALLSPIPTAPVKSEASNALSNDTAPRLAPKA